MLVIVGKKKPPPTAFGRNLRAKRLAAGMTQRELADAVGMSRLVIGRLESSPSANPQLDTIHKLASALKCKPIDLIDEPAGR